MPHDGLCRFAELGGRCVADPGKVTGTLDARHLHSKADAEERDLSFAGEFDAGDLAFAAPLTETAGDKDSVQRLQFGDDIKSGCSNNSASIH